VSSIFADHPKPNVASAKGQQFPGHVLVLVNQSYNFVFGSFDKQVKSRVMLLHASVTKIVLERVLTRRYRVAAEICGGLASGLLPRCDQLKNPVVRLAHSQ
jgi:hypothetical protein